MTDNSKILNLRSLDIVLINYVEGVKKNELLKELEGLYGEHKPLEIGVGSGLTSWRTISPYERFDNKILYYDDVDDLKKPLPEKFESLEIRIVNHIASWCTVICKVRLKQEYLEKAKQEFTDRLEKDNKLTTPDIFTKAHLEFENYLAPHIMDNIISKHTSEKRRAYPFLYLGEVGELPSKNIMDIIKATDNTRIGIGSLGLRWASIFERLYLIVRTGGGQSGLIVTRDRGFSILRTFHIAEGEYPASWTRDTRRSFKSLGSEYSIIDNISSLLLPYIVLSYRLESVNYWDKENVSLSHKIQELLDKENSRDYLNSIANLQREIGSYRSRFLSKSFDMHSECDELSALTTCAHKYLLSRNFDDSPREEPFFHPIGAETRFVQEQIRSGNPKQGVLISMVIDSETMNEQLLKKIGKIEEGQIKLSDYVHDILNVSLQKRMERLTRTMVWVTWTLVILAIIQTILVSYQLMHAPVYQIIQTPTPTP